MFLSSLPVLGIELHQKPVQAPPLSVTKFHESVTHKKWGFSLFPSFDDKINISGWKFELKINELPIPDALLSPVWQSHIEY